MILTRDVIRAYLFAALLVGCAPSVRVAGTCPRALPLAADFAASAGLLAASAAAYNAGRTGLSAGAAIGGLGVALLANLSECRP